MALRGIAHGFDTAPEQKLQHTSFVVRCAADDEVARPFAPHLLEPFEIGLESAGSDNKRFRAKRSGLALEPYRAACEFAIRDVELRDLRVIENANASLGGRSIMRVHQRFSPAEEERIRSIQVQRAPKRGLKSNAMRFHPLCRGE